jgi:hypothetical protein
VDPAQPMIDWINSVPPAELAMELMTAFSSDGPHRGTHVSSYDLIEWMFRDYPKQTGIFVAARPVNESISEAVQLLEHSELIYLRWFSNDYPVWSVTRLGTATLRSGKDAVRQRITDRTGR